MTLFEMWYIGMTLVVLIQQITIYCLIHKIEDVKNNYIIKIVDNKSKK